MAASRKLQAEIDRCLKKVSEGVELFEEVWTKVHNATNSNQKDKYESDLKKEIKKLQRLRDQIKAWIASGEIKDKTILIETRKLIETQMERFKVVERETKTKAYSKEGLGLVTKSDPITRERDDLNTWLINTIDNMQMQIDAFECDIETLLASKKKKLDKEKQEKLDLYKKVVDKHKFHVGKLEVILRTLDNIANEEKLPIFLTQVKKIKEDVDYYLDSAQDPEYEENEYLYDDIECLDDILGSGVGSSTISPSPTPVMDTNPSTPTTSTGRMSPSLQTLAIEKQQQEYLRQHEIQLQLHQQHYENHGFPERRKSYTDDGSCAAKIFKPLPVKASTSGSAGGYGAKVPPPSSNNNVSPYLQNSVDGTESFSDSQTVDESKNSVTPSLMEGGDPGLIDNSFVSEHEFKPPVKRSPLVVSEPKYVKPIPLVATPPPQPFTPVNVPPSEPILDAVHSSNGLIHHQIHRPGSFDQPETSLGKEREGSIDFTALPNTQLTNCNHLSQSPGASIMGSSNVVVMHPKVVRSEPMVVRNESIVRSDSMLRTEQVLQNEQIARPDPTHMLNTEQTVRSEPTIATEQNPMRGETVRPEQNVRSEHEPNHTYTPHPLTESDPEILRVPMQSRMQEPQLQRQEDIILQQQQQPVNNTSHLSSAHEQMIMEQYIGGGGDAPDSHLTTLKSMAQEVMTRAGLNFSADQRPVSDATTSAHIPPLLGVAPLGPVPLHPKHDYQLSMLEAAHYHLPVPSDSEPLRHYLPRNPMPTPNYYPQAPLINSDTLEFFGRMPIETLFFIFYYLEGTRAQYMAAKVLKKQSWRFHTKFMMWFQRHEEPKVINEVYEQGTYIYFDIEKWGQRKKDGFVFEYQYLEDRDLN